ncbi:MAG: hypothetical protein GX239_02865, partial [Clostridiaceae bacterium]|nr:hypothetical protein [Clostridiaceae bacterium]
MTKMRQRVEATGKTYEDALQNGLEALGVDQTADVSCLIDTQSFQTILQRILIR